MAIGIDVSAFKNNSTIITPEVVGSDVKQAAEKKKKSSKKSSTTTTTIEGKEIVTVDSNDNVTVENQLPMMQSNVPYVDTYNEPMNIMRSVVGQMDQLYTEVKTDLDEVRASRTLKGKYQYIPQLSSSLSSLIGSKIQAANAISKMITDGHNLDMKRQQQVKAAAADKDDSQYIADMYQAFISTGPQNGFVLGPNAAQLATGNELSGIIRAGASSEDPAYDQFVQNMNPVQKAMRYENSSVKTVVYFDQDSGKKWFAKVDTNTGQDVPGLPVPDPMFLDDIRIDIKNAVARNTNLDQNYPLIVVGSNNLGMY